MIQTTLRIEQSLYDKIVNLANKDKRSINQEIIFIFEEYLEMLKWKKER